MKKLLYLVAILLLIVFTVQAQEMPKKSFERAEKGYLCALSSDNTGLAEDAVFCVLIFYARYPDNNFSKMEEQLRKLAFNGSTSMIRIKAYMAFQSLKSRTWFDDAKTAMKEHNPEDMFTILSEHFVENERMFVRN